MAETIEPFFDKYDLGKLLTSEYRKRLVSPKAIRLHRFASEEIYCSFVNSTQSGIDILKYDFAEKNWNQFKNISFEKERSVFGSIFLNGELFVMGGRYYNSYINYVSIHETGDV